MKTFYGVELSSRLMLGTARYPSPAILADAFRAQIVDASVESFVFEVTGKPAKIDSFINLMQPLGLVEVVRTGLAAISRGAQGM